MRFSLPVTVIALSWVAVGACGGKTESGGTGGTGGGGAQAGSGGGGAGAVGGSGAYGGGGVGAYGGGGVGAYGGGGVGAYGGGGVGAYGGGGVGAFGGGGSGAFGGAGGAGGLDAKAAKVCSVISTLPCAMPDCKQQLDKTIQVSVASGCGDVLDAVFDCALQYPMYCSPDGQDPALSPACDPVLAKLESCVNGNSCSGSSSSAGDCTYDCPNWGVACKPGTVGLYCYCTFGPNTGKQFAMAGLCNGPGWEQTVAKACN